MRKFINNLFDNYRGFLPKITDINLPPKPGEITSYLGEWGFKVVSERFVETTKDIPYELLKDQAQSYVEQVIIHMNQGFEPTEDQKEKMFQDNYQSRIDDYKKNPEGKLELIITTPFPGIRFKVETQGSKRIIFPTDDPDVGYRQELIIDVTRYSTLTYCGHYGDLWDPIEDKDDLLYRARFTWALRCLFKICDFKPIYLIRRGKEMKCTLAPFPDPPKINVLYNDCTREVTIQVGIVDYGELRPLTYAEGEFSFPVNVNSLELQIIKL